jgi:phosphatidate cytidylyltransferase
LILTVSGFSIGGLGLYFASRTVPRSDRSNRWVKFVTYFGITHFILLSALVGSIFLGIFFLVVLALGAWELRGAATAAGPRHRVWWVAAALIYFLLSICVLTFVFHSSPQIVIFVYLVVATFDGFSQIAGQLLGKHLLAAKISPGKTIEGVIGGLLFAAIMAILLRSITNLTSLQSLKVCSLIVLSGLFGDLAASWTKRLSGLKNFGTVLPGHGGFLDRFDSFLFAAPVCYVFFYLR